MSYSKRSIIQKSNSRKNNAQIVKTSSKPLARNIVIDYSLLLELQNAFEFVVIDKQLSGLKFEIC